MAKYRSEFVKQAQNWVGKKESNGSHKEIIDVYNSHRPLARGYKVKYTDAWCSTFVSAVAIELGYTDIIPTECGCEKHIDLFKKKGIWVENDGYVPFVGDIIFYDWEDDGKGDNVGRANHVGIVEKVSNGTITVIEGNINNAVGRRTLKINGKYIRGFGVPKFDNPTPAKPTPTKSIEAVAKEVIAGKWGNGSKRKKAIEQAGYNYKEVQAKVNELSKKKPATKPATKTVTKVVVRTNSLRVRNKAGLTGKIIGHLKRGTKVTIYATKGSWVKISATQEKWCSKNFLK